jgi:FHA domain
MEQNNKSSSSFFRELKRRKVTRTCILYLFLCWGVLQVGDIIYPALGLDPDKASLLFLYLAIAGFPATFAIAWFLQITPQGIVRTGSFVERRVLSNVPPINERRQGVNMTTYFRKGEQTQDYHWVVSAETGPLAGLSFGVTKPLMMGRSLDCDIAMVSPQVSRNHARLDLEDDQLYIEDMGSANGTVVNGRAAEGRQALHNDDEIRFHDIVFRVVESFTGARSEIEAMHQTTFINKIDIPPPKE